MFIVSKFANNMYCQIQFYKASPESVCSVSKTRLILFILSQSHLLNQIYIYRTKRKCLHKIGREMAKIIG